MLARTGVAFQGRGFESHRGDSTTRFTPNYARLRGAAVSSTRTFFSRPCTRVELSFFHFSLLSWI